MNGYRLYNAYPAARWHDATPTGNGRVGAMVYGNLTGERILLNHERFWYHGRRQPLPDVSAGLAEVRRLMTAGRYQEAQTYLPELVRRQGYCAGVASYMPGFDLCIRQDPGGAFSAYRRELDMTTGEITVGWQIGAVGHERRLFASRADGDLVLLRMGADHPGQITCRLTLEPHDLTDAFHYGGASFTVDNRYTSAAAGDTLTVRGETTDGFVFSAAARVYAQGGSLCAQEAEVCVRGADSVTLRIALVPGAEPEAAIQALATPTGDYAALLERHIALHRPAFLRSELHLTEEDDPDREKSNEQLLLDAYTQRPGAALLERMYHYSRFLMLCSSVPGGLPAGLQGVWNGDYEPPWGGSFFYNENVQLSYWQALPCNGAEALLPLFDLLERQLPDFRENARRLYGCRGIFVPLYGDADCGLLRDLQPHVVYWTAGAGWLARHFYDYYLYTGDRDFLRRRAVPFMKEAALFYQDFFVTGEDGYFLSMPGNSPENCAAGRFPGARSVPVCINPTMDFAVAKDVLHNLCAACGALGIEEENRPLWEEMLRKIPPLSDQCGRCHPGMDAPGL